MDAPSPTRGVSVELDRTRHLRYTLRTIREIREEFGPEALETGQITADEMGKLLWYGLRHEAPEAPESPNLLYRLRAWLAGVLEGFARKLHPARPLTVEDVEDMVDLRQLDRWSDAIMEAMGGEEREDGAVPPTGRITAPRKRRPKAAKT